jgi:hypothetical protein
MWSWLLSLFQGKQEVVEPQQLNEAPSNQKPLEKMTKAELDALGKHHGVKLDGRKKKAVLIETLKDNNVLHG